MAVLDIREICLFPPLAIGHFGASAEPMHNHEITIASDGSRRLEPRETLIVDVHRGEIVANTLPSTIRPVDSKGLVKPVCPFIELWGRYDDTLKLAPLTLRELADIGLGPEAVSWDVGLVTLPLLLQSGGGEERLRAEQLGIADHAKHCLLARSIETAHHRPVPLGWVQYIRPTKLFPEIRLRFTPPAHAIRRGGEEADSAPSNQVRPAMNLFLPGAKLGTGDGKLDVALDGVIAAALALPDGRELRCFSRLVTGTVQNAAAAFDGHSVYEA